MFLLHVLGHLYSLIVKEEAAVRRENAHSICSQEDPRGEKTKTVATGAVRMRAAVCVQIQAWKKQHFTQHSLSGGN